MNFCSSINKKIKKRNFAGAFCVLFLVLILAVPCAYSGEKTGFTVFRAEFESVPQKKKNSKPVKDFYINGGKDDGLSKSMVLDVYREKTLVDRENEEDFKIRIPVGQLRVFSVFKDVSVARIKSLTTTKENPILEYRTVMVGDIAVPRSSIRKAKSQGVVFPSNVLFQLNDWRLKPEAETALARVHDIFNESRDKNIIVEGHTCSVGSKEYNLELSRKRARSVSDYLVNKKGIPKNRVRIEYYGERYPLALNNTEEGRFKNRRVVIRFLSL
jgi:outer membrane protein OmpA-like peptidoglycan-associated protein